jgi:pilus assembly protein CpaE
LLNGFVVRHSSGLEVLTSPDMPSVQHKSSPSEVDQVLNFLRNQYEFILIDSSLDYKDVVSPMMRGSDEVSLIITPDVAALRDLARRLEAFNLDEETARKMRIIVNRSGGTDDAVNAEQIEAVIHHPVAITLPNAYTDVLRAINAGQPLPPQHRSKFADQINKWADKMVAAAMPQSEIATIGKKKFSLFGSRREQLA